jgi:hypothetical protein
MPMPELMEHLDVVYSRGWQGSAAQVVGPLTPEKARARDESGAPYAVLLLAEGRLSLVVEVAWSRHSCVIWCIDGHGRREGRRELRLLEDGRLFLLEQTVWGYADEEQPELDSHASRRTLRYEPDGTLRDSFAERGDHGGSFIKVDHVDATRLREKRPKFGAWAPLVAPMGTVATDARLTVRDSLPDTMTASTAEDPGWSAPRPLDPLPYLEPMLRAGSRFDFRDSLGEAVVELVSAPDLVLTSGRLVAHDPTWIQDQPAYDVDLPAGTFPVTQSVVRWVDDPEHTRVAAARLTIEDVDPVSWEPALRPGQDTRQLGDKEFFGFGVDAGLGCLVDADGIDDATAVIGSDYEMFMTVDAEHPMKLDLDEGRTMVIFASGWGDGSYPCWIGRCAEGGVVCLVVDLLVVNDATLIGHRPK